MNNFRFVFFALLVSAGMASCKKSDKAATIESIEFKKGTYELYENDDLNIKRELVITPDNIINDNPIQWKVSDENIAKIESGYFYPELPGNVKVTATVQGKSATCNITILETPIEKITLTSADVALNNSQSIDFTTEPSGISPKRISWSSSNPDIVSIDEDGVLYGNAVGSATITATSGDAKGTCTITVKKINVTGVEISPKSIKNPTIGSTIQLSATIKPDNASVKSIKWTSSSSVATVDENGLVKILGTGTAIITATADGGVFATCTVNIVESGTVTDCEGNTYPTIKIGEQWWMAENLRCSTYSKSSGVTVTMKERTSAESGDTYEPFYVDARKQSNWVSTQYSGNLSESNISKLGYLYNLAAALGLPDGKTQKSYTNRQGICPDGWHIPSMSEWGTLGDFVKNSSANLMSEDGWYTSSKSISGTDAYGFNALPASSWSGKYRMRNTGAGAYFLTSTYYIYDDDYYNHIEYIYYDNPSFTSSNTANYTALSVRCIKD